MDGGRAPVADAAAPVLDAGLAPDAGARDGGAPCEADEHEPSDSPATAAAVPLEPVSPGETEATVVSWMYGSLCSGDEDWYMVPASAFPFSPRAVRVRLLARDAGWCGSTCGEIELLPAPENTVFLEVYGSSGTVLYEGLVREDGDLEFYLGSSAGDDDFYMRVHGPAEAVYSYRLYIEISNIEGEDECEC